MPTDDLAGEGQHRLPEEQDWYYYYYKVAQPYAGEMDSRMDPKYPSLFTHYVTIGRYVYHVVTISLRSDLL